MGKIITHTIGSLSSNAAIEEIIAEDYDVSRITTSRAFRFNSKLQQKKTLLFQIDWDNLDDTDATVVLRHSNNGKDGTFKDVIGLVPITLSTASGTDYLEVIDFSGGFVDAFVVLNTVATGTIGIHALAKD